jgi:hypothetical protein
MKTAIDSEIDALFALPLDEFTAARNALASLLKKEGRAGDAARVKTLEKPPVSAWAVNQLYWRHRDAFDRLLAAGKEFRKAQASQLSGKAANLQESQNARSEALNELSRFAAELLQAGGHTPSPETLRRVRTTLEAISTGVSSPGGRLTSDVDPPGFDALAALVSNVSILPRPKERQERKHASDETAIANAKAALRSAEQALKRARAIADEAAKGVDDAERAVKNASSKLQSLIQGTMKSRVPDG